MSTMSRSLRRSTPLAAIMSDVFGSGVSFESKEAVHTHPGTSGTQFSGTQLDAASSAARSPAATRTEITTTQHASMSSSSQRSFGLAVNGASGASYHIGLEGSCDIVNIEVPEKRIETLGSVVSCVADSQAHKSDVTSMEAKLHAPSFPSPRGRKAKQASDRISRRSSPARKHQCIGSSSVEAVVAHVYPIQSEDVMHDGIGSTKMSKRSGNIHKVNESGEDDIPDDDWLSKLMKRRAERNAPEADSENKNTKMQMTKAVQKEARISAIEILDAQLSELARVRAAAQDAGWLGGCMDDQRALDVAPPAPLAVAAQAGTPPFSRVVAKGRRGIFGWGNRGRDDAIAAHPLATATDMKTVLPAVQLPVDLSCAAQATDSWDVEHRGLLAEAARAYRRSRAEGPEAESEALATLQGFRQRAKEEPGRRAIMRSCGVCPRSAVFEKASIGRSGEGRMPARVIANEFEAKTFLPSMELGNRIESVQPGLLGAWQDLEEGQVDLLTHFAGSKDFIACADIAAGLGAEVSGLFVGRLALSGLSREYPFLVRSGLTHFLCEGCERWVSKSEARQHNVRCVGDVAGRARVFKQRCGESLGLVLSFKHLPKSGLVELQAEAAIDAAIRRACWACYWEPDRIRCAWRLARRESRELNINSTSKELATRKRRGETEAGAGPCENSDSPRSEEDAEIEMEGSFLQHESFEVGVTVRRSRSCNNFGVSETPPSKATQSSSPKFSLQSSFKANPAEQPWSFVRPLTRAQLHTLGWMMEREACVQPYHCTQILRETLAETDVCLEVRIERAFESARGGILGDALGYGKTACMIALIAETRHQSLPELLNLSDWPKIAGQRVLTNATLVVTPPNLFDQWLREIRKFVVSSSGLRILAVPSHSKLKTLTIADFVAADIILVSFRFFFSEAYQRYFDELTKPGLKVWDEMSVHRRDEFCKRRKFAQLRVGEEAGAQKRLKQETERVVKRELDVCEAEHAPPCQFEMSMSKKSLAHASAQPVIKQENTERSADPLAHSVLDLPKAIDAASDGSLGKAAAQSMPALQPSRYYLELRGKKDYLPQRYLDLQRRTRRLLREAQSAEELAQSPALFEMFHFKRIVFDEFHEVVQMSAEQAISSSSSSSSARAPFYALHALEGRCHWGLTATPFLSSAAAVAHMASLLKVFLPHDDDAEAQRFLDTWVTSNTWDDSGIPLKEHWVEVDLLGVEQALYLHQRNILSAQGGCGPDSSHARAAERRLLQLCTHFDPEGVVGESAGDAQAALLHTLERQRSLQEQAVLRQRMCEMQRDEILCRREACDRLCAALPESTREASLACAHCEVSEVQSLAEAALHASDARLNSELALVEADLRRLAQSAVDGQSPAVTTHSDSHCEQCRHLELCDERVKQLNRSKGHAQGDQRNAESHLRFLEAVSSGLDAREAHCTECPACLNDIDSMAATILPCGHCFHHSCAAAAISTTSRCPQCRRPATLQSCTKVAELLHHQGTVVPSDPIACKESSTLDGLLRRQYGSKLFKVIETIRNIQDSEGKATKCLVFVQWEGVSAQLEKGLKAAGISPVVLRGHLSQRQKAIARFVEQHIPDASVLLLSLENSPSGMNLACAHHVLFVHPMHAERCEDAASHELQAIGRVRRRGQNHTVHVHRFVARGTVEEALTKQHREICQQRQHSMTDGQ